MIEVLRLDVVTVNGKANQAEAKPLDKDTSYISVVDMLSYLSGHL